MEAQKKLKVGVIGLGKGSYHLEQYQKEAHVEICCVADLNPERLERARETYNIPRVYTCAEEMLAKEALDIVSICTPNKFHKPLTIAALRRGMHVLCEKPMAMNAAEAHEMLEEAKKADRRLMINFSYRFTDVSHALKKQVETGVLGDIYYGRSIWHRRRGIPGLGGWFGIKELSGGGPLIDLGVHRLDFALWLMGYPRPKWVLGTINESLGREVAKAAGKPFDVEDLAAAMITFENGASLTIEASWATNQKENEKMETLLFGTKGGLRQRNLNEGYAFEAELFMESGGNQFDMKVHPPVATARTSVGHFVDSIVAGTPHTATAEEGYIVMQILDAIYESARLGRPVEIQDAP